MCQSVLLQHILDHTYHLRSIQRPEILQAVSALDFKGIHEAEELVPEAHGTTFPPKVILLIAYCLVDFYSFRPLLDLLFLNHSNPALDGILWVLSDFCWKSGTKGLTKLAVHYHKAIYMFCY